MKPDLILYPDGSMKLYGKEFYSGYGVVVLNPKSDTYTILEGELSKKSVVYCEAWAIYQGLRYVEHLRKKAYPKSKVLNILVVSDSKICVDTFNKWIKYVWDTSDWNNWTKANKEPVKNQDIYRSIMRILSSGRYKVKFIHINSHVRINQDSINRIQEKLDKANVKLSRETVYSFMKMNDLADKAARSATTRSKDLNGQFEKLEYQGGISL